MSFSRSAIKRFNEETGCAPPVGHYHPNYRDKKVGASFDRSKRFSELDGASDCLGPPEALTRTLSECSTSNSGVRSPRSSESPSLKKKVKTEQDYLNTIKSLREKIAFLQQKSSTKQRSVAGSIVKCKGGQDVRHPLHNNSDAVACPDASQAFFEDVFFAADYSCKDLAMEVAATGKKDACVNTSLEDNKSSGKSEQIACMIEKISKLEAESQRMTSSLENLEKKTAELEGTAQKYASLQPKIANYQEVLCELISDICSKIALVSNSGKKILTCKQLPQTQNCSITSHQTKCLEQLQELSFPHLDTSEVRARLHRLAQEVEVLNAVTELICQQNKRNAGKLVKENLDLKSAVKELRTQVCGKAVDGTLLCSQESQIKILQSEVKAAIRDLEKKEQQVRDLKASLEDSNKKSELMIKDLELKDHIIEENTIKWNKTIVDLEILVQANGKALEEAKSSNDQLIRKIDSLQDDVNRVIAEKSEIQKELDCSRVRVGEYMQLAHELKEELCSKSAQLDSKSLLEVESLKMEVERQKIDIQRLEEENQSEDKENSWKSKYEELEQKVAPFRDQLDGYARERDMLLLQYSETSSELAAINEKYARSMGHQNHKQKIRYVEKLQTEINQLRQEIHHWQQKYIKQQLELESLRRPQLGSSHNTPVKSKSAKP